MNLVLSPANLDDPADAAAVRGLIDAYARDPMGGGEALDEGILEAVIPRLREHPTTRIWLARDAGQAVGAAICFLGFTTFEARRLLNIHDLMVAASHRRRGVGRALLEAVEAGARSLDCCRVTLEVRQDNEPARALYADFGLRGYVLGGEEHPMYFITKEIRAEG